LKVEEEIKRRNLELEEASANPERLQTICTEIGLAETRLEQLYLRWEELDKKHRGS
jgi:hypothetical protein